MHCEESSHCLTSLFKALKSTWEAQVLKWSKGMLTFAVFLGQLPGKLADVDALGCNLVNMMATAFSSFWLIGERSHVGTERRHFWHTYSCIFSAYVVKISDPGHSRSGHQVMSNDLTSEKVWKLVIATPNDWPPSKCQRLISLTNSIFVDLLRCMSRRGSVS